MPQIIGILGKKRSGKDTIADYLVARYNFTKLKFADPLKDVCKILFGFTDEQLNGDLKEEIDKFWKISPRYAMQYLGTDLFRNQITPLLPNISNDFWIKIMELKLLNTTGPIVIADIRFQNEIDLIHKHKGIIIKINSINTDDTDQHESEININNLLGDFTVYNDIILVNLYKQIDTFMGTLKMKFD